MQDTSKDDGERSVAGDIVALLAAMGYGLYTTVIRLFIPDDEGISMQLLLGYIGIINAVIAAPVLIVMLLLNLESTVQVSGAVLGFIFLNGFCDNVLSDYFWARAVVLTSPTVATIGVSITIPLAIISDICLGKAVLTYLSILGAILVVLGFMLVNIDNEIWHQIGMKLGIVSIDATDDRPGQVTSPVHTKQPSSPPKERDPW
jgi:solute carrier family 35, member F5